jgi:hypothetical protein
MRFKEFLREAPLADFRTTSSTGSDFDTQRDHDGAFKAHDRKLVKHPVHQAKLVKFFSKTPYDFKILVANTDSKRNLGGNAEGEVKKSDYRKLIDEYGIPAATANRVFMDNEKAITIIFTGNDSEDPMTPWIMAHRIAHSYDDSHNGDIKDAVSKILREYVIKCYGIPNGAYEPVLTLARKLMTSKAARSGAKLPSETEAAMELFAEYVLRDKITMNPFPEQLVRRALKRK